MCSNDKGTRRVGEDILATYFKEIDKIPLLSCVEEQGLGYRVAKPPFTRVLGAFSGALRKELEISGIED